ncbi:hypothetical protein CI610_03019 [invertebrate metagenome]|uniref:DUF599 domain-containing protein n=1 Tax=invertebrate metagenome TaxID=1711999 RepID=A0A2H9T489_9ZZZZ
MALVQEMFWDWLALVALLGGWAGYTLYAAYHRKQRSCLASVMALYRRDWMLRLLGRDNRIADASFISTLRASVSFFASTSILVIAGLITAIAASEEAIGVLSTIPFVSTTTRELWEVRVILLLIIFIYSFFEFTWSLRLYNFSCVVMSSAPLVREITDKTKEKNAFADKAGHLVTMAAHHFNMGLRSYYFAMATIAWFVHPGLMILAVCLVVWILYRREFHSQVLNVLSYSHKNSSHYDQNTDGQTE